MRSLILFTILCAFSFIDLHAQVTNETPNFVIGIQAGAAISRASSRGEISFKQRSVMRPVFGLYADIGSSHLISIRTGVSYLLLGNKVEYAQGNWKTKLNYIAIPLLAKYKARGGEFALFAGPQLSFLTTATMKYPYHDWEDIKDNCGKTDIALVLGASIEPKNSPVNFTLSWHRGFQKVYTEKNGNDLYNRGVTLAIQYKLFKR